MAPGCSSTATARGYCNNHYHLAMRLVKRVAKAKGKTVESVDADLVTAGLLLPRKTSLPTQGLNEKLKAFEETQSQNLKL
jgi:type IV secretory pathway protease TraF